MAYYGVRDVVVPSLLLNLLDYPVRLYTRKYDSKGICGMMNAKIPRHIEPWLESMASHERQFTSTQSVKPGHNCFEGQNPNAGASSIPVP
jgi:hypothetical protein